MCWYQDAPKNIEAVKKDLEDAEVKLNKKIDAERQERFENDEEIKEDIEKILGRKDATVPSLVSKSYNSS